MKEAAYDKKKLNNAGMTLVEILVAIAILSVAIVPLMYSFIYAARHNAKARDLQQTSIFAHTVIENCKAYSLDEIEAAVTNTAAPTYPFLKNADKSVKVNDGLYYFDDVKVYEDAASGYTSNQVYDIEMAITPYGGTQTLMNYETMNAYNDAVFMAESTNSTGSPATQAVKLDAEAYDTVVAAIQSMVQVKSQEISPDQPGVEVILTEAEIINSFKSGGLNAGKLRANRSINVTAGVAADHDYALVYYKYEYTLDGNLFQYEYTDATGATNVYSVDCSNPSGGPHWTIGRTFNIYDNTNTKDKTELDDIYLFYYPAYKESAITQYPCVTDTININNALGRDLEVYLIKQKNPYMTEAEMEIGEASYNLQLYDTSVAGAVGTIKVYHNQATSVTGSGATTSWNPGSVSLSIDLVDYDDTSTTGSETLIERENKQLMYGVTVKVYAHDAYKEVAGVHSMSGEALAEMSGTFLNW